MDGTLLSLLVLVEAPGVLLMTGPVRLMHLQWQAAGARTHVWQQPWSAHAPTLLMAACTHLLLRRHWRPHSGDEVVVAHARGGGAAPAQAVPFVGSPRLHSAVT